MKIPVAGFRIHGLGVRDWGPSFRFSGLGFMVRFFWCRVVGFRASGVKFQTVGVGRWFRDSGVRASGVGFRILDSRVYGPGFRA